MDQKKTEEIKHTTNSDHGYDGKQTCLLEDNDTQCGHVFFNEITRFLKFYCTYCQETYDNIEFFCQHLSEHIKEEEQTLCQEVKHKGEVEQELCQQAKACKQEEEAIIDLIEDLDDIEKKPNTLNGEREELEIISSFPTAETDDEDTRDALEYEEIKDKSLKNEISDYPMNTNLNNDHDLNDEEMIIEEIEDDSEEIRAEIEQEISATIIENDYTYLMENNSPADIIDYDGHYQDETLKTSANLDNTKNGKTFEECFIKETNIDRIRTEGVCVLKEKAIKEQKPIQRRRTNIQDLLRLKRRHKKVTTVKVIAVKNRIAELYERIQKEKQKSQQIYSASDFIHIPQEQEIQDAVENLINDEDERHNNPDAIDARNRTSQQTSKDVTRKIIGETVITLIPEGTKIPNKLPLPLNKPLKNELSSQASTTTYRHYKADETKDKLAVCPACGKTFRNHFSLTIHKRIHYLESDSSVKLAHKCSDCDELFNKLSQLKHHVETVHYPDGFICKICNRQLSSISLLERHMVKVHLDRPFNCNKCNKNFSDPLTYEEHLASHSSGEEYKCSTCGRKYATEFFLMEHMRNHKEQIPQTCVVCGKVTLRITQHMKIHTPRPKRLLSCSVCGKVFNFSSGLSHHFKIMHKLPRPPPKPKKESQNKTSKRRKRSRPNERSTANNGNRIKQTQSNSTDSTFILEPDKCSGQIIEEQIEIPHEVYDSTPISLESKQTFVEQSALHDSSQCYLANIQTAHNHQVFHGLEQRQQDDIINHKEEEAKRVIVELIQNSAYSTFFPDNLSSVLEVTPPIAREETISAVNSIVHDC